MDEAFERVVAENRQLQKEVKGLHERVLALESSRWWRLHPRVALGLLHQRADAAAPDTSKSKVARVARQWRLRVLHERRNAGLPADEIVLRDDIRLKIHPESRYSIEHFCFRSPQMVDELDAFIAATSDRGRLLDVGAFHGLFSLVFAVNASGKQALAADPSPRAFAILLYNIHKSRAKNIIAVECALSNEAGPLRMHYEWQQAVAGEANGCEPSFSVEGSTGDRVCAEHAFDPDVIKIDVEGHELRVVQGLRETIGGNRPLIFLELHPATIAANANNGTSAELVNELRELGYSRAERSGRTVPVDMLTGLTEIERLLLLPD